jgi:hypothetical protein
MTNVISEPTFKHGVIEMVENTKIEWCDHTFNLDNLPVVDRPA